MAVEIINSRPELILVADAVAREKGIDRDAVIAAMEEAISKAGRARYGTEKDIRAKIDRRHGGVSISRWTEIVDPSAFDGVVKKLDISRHMPIEVALRIKPDAIVGEFIVDPLPPIDFGRIAAQTAKQVIVQRVREVERKKQYEAFKDRVGEIVSGLVKRSDSGNVLIDLGGNSEAIIPRKEQIPRESFKIGDRVRAYIAEVREEQKGPQIFLSRTHPGFLAKLFAQEVPEIYDGVIEIKAVARDPGSRAKMAVTCRDSSIDPVGACIGRMGARVKAVSSELGGERVDIITWTSNVAQLLGDALQPATISKVILHDDGRKIEVIVAEDQMSLAIGRRGQNVRLAGMLTRCEITLMTEAEEHDRRVNDHTRRTALFIEELDVDEMLAAFLVTEGFETVEELAYCDVDELAMVEGMDEGLASELVNRALDALNRKENVRVTEGRKAGAEYDLIALPFLTSAMLAALANAKVTTREELADLDTFELREIFGEDNLSAEAANSFIMEARAHWFDDDAELNPDDSDAA